MSRPDAAPVGRFPEGAWFSVVGHVRLGAGGQTRMVLLRHRLFVQAGLDFPILTYDPIASYDPIRAGLLADGLLLEQSRLLNLHEDLRVRSLVGTGAAVTAERRTAIEDTENGVVWRRRITDETGTEQIWQYLRPDGSVYAETPVDQMIGPTRVLDPEGRIVMAGAGLGDLWRWWTREIVPDDGPVFLVSDSRFIAEELGLLDDPRMALMHQMHNPHLRGARRWDSPIEPSYAASLEHVDRLDALNTLTERQRRDLATRFGDLDQFHVVANPVEPVEVPEPQPDRVPGRIVMLARLHPQKRVDRALESFALLAADHATATLEIYGDGDDQAALVAQAIELGIADRVTFHGHDPHAADALWSADLAWLTSRFEGYGLIILESRMRGCPVVAFDVPYGPAEQIDSGVDGVLVPPGDVAALARATLDLLADRERLESMRAPARTGALAHGSESFLTAWAEVGATAMAQKATRTRVDEVSARVSGRTATVTVRGLGDPADIIVRWQAWRPGDAAAEDLTTAVNRDGLTFSLQASRAPSGATERLLLTWHNSTWQQTLPPRRRWFRR